MAGRAASHRLDGVADACRRHRRATPHDAIDATPSRGHQIKFKAIHNTDTNLVDRLDPIDLIRGHHARAARFHSFTFVPPVGRLIRRQRLVDELALGVHGPQHELYYRRRSTR